MIDWPRIYAHVCANTGWTWDYVRDHLDMPRLQAMYDNWRDQPPLRAMVAAYLGIKPQERAKPNSDDGMRELLEAFPVQQVATGDGRELSPEEAMAAAERLYFGGVAHG